MKIWMLYTEKEKFDRNEKVDWHLIEVVHMGCQSNTIKNVLLVKKLDLNWKVYSKFK